MPDTTLTRWLCKQIREQNEIIRQNQPYVGSQQAMARVDAARISVTHLQTLLSQQFDD